MQRSVLLLGFALVFLGTPSLRAHACEGQEVIFEDAPIIKAYQQAHIFGISNRLDWKPWIDNMLFLYDARLK